MKQTKSKQQLQAAFKIFIQAMAKSNGIGETKFTQDLYETIHTSGPFMAHFNKQGFIEAKFRTLNNFDGFIDGIRATDSLAYLLEGLDLDLIAQSSFRIAASESRLLIAQALNMMNMAKDLQSKFTWEF